MLRVQRCIQAGEQVTGCGPVRVIQKAQVTSEREPHQALVYKRHLGEKAISKLTANEYVGVNDEKQDNSYWQRDKHESNQEANSMAHEGADEVNRGWVLGCGVWLKCETLEGSKDE